MDLKTHLRHVPDFPKPGILFYDISTLIANPTAWRRTIDLMSTVIEPLKPDLLVGIESRGFLVTAPLAYSLGCGFAMMRKKGKLPGPVISHDYDLEYGTDTIQLQADALEKGQRIVLLDDLLATGGTMAAAVTLAKKMGADVCLAAFIIELVFLKGRERLDCPVESLLQYQS